MSISYSTIFSDTWQFYLNNQKLLKCNKLMAPTILFIYLFIFHSKYDGLVFILLRQVHLNFKNLKHIKSGQGLTFVSTVDKCLRLFIIQQGTMVVLTPTGHCGNQSKNYYQALYKQHHLLLFQNLGTQSASNAKQSMNTFNVIQCYSNQFGKCFKIKQKCIHNITEMHIQFCFQ